MARPPLAPAPEHVLVRAPETGLKASKINTSKKWELPPRPKPGRKAKPRQAKCMGHTVSVAPPPMHQPQGNSNAHDNDDNCGICTGDTGGCICAEVGLRPAPPRDRASPANTLPTPGSDTKEIDFSNFDFKSAVPLNRVSKSRNLGPKFAKLPDVQPPTLDLPDSRCGFCTDQTPCVCTGEGLQKEASPESVDRKVDMVTPTSMSGESTACEELQKDPFGVLFCLSLDACRPVPQGVPTISCAGAFQTLKTHRNYHQCDLGRLVTYLQASNHRVGIQSVNEGLQYLNSL